MKYLPHPNALCHMVSSSRRGTSGQRAAHPAVQSYFCQRLAHYVPAVTLSPLVCEFPNVDSTSRWLQKNSSTTSTIRHLLSMRWPVRNTRMERAARYMQSSQALRHKHLLYRGNREQLVSADWHRKRHEWPQGVGHRKTSLWTVSWPNPRIGIVDAWLFSQTLTFSTHQKLKPAYSKPLPRRLDSRQSMDCTVQIQFHLHHWISGHCA